MLTPGQVIDRYEVLGPIATGGMAEVFRVKHSSLGTTHALKVLVLRTQDIKRRLLQEGRVQALLRHVNAVAVTDVIDVDGHPGLVMEYIDGPTLLDWCYDERPHFDTIEQVFRAVVEGVAAAHELDLVHRDLKPSNILISGEDPDWVPKVCDFGLAKVLYEEQGEDATRTGVPMGTPSYMAPEQIADAKSVDARADIFSLGALLYYMVTGKKAFDGRNAVETYNAVLDGTYLPPKQHTPDLPDHLDAAIRVCLRVDPRARCANTRALLEILDGGTAPPSRPTPAVTVMQPKVLGGAAIGGFVAGCAVLLALWWLARPVEVSPIAAAFVPTFDVGPVTEPVRTVTIPQVVVAPPCRAAGKDYGVAPVQDRIKKGEVVTFSGDTPLRTEAGGARNGCVLPAGTKVTALERSDKKGGQHWVVVTVSATDFP